MSALPIKHSRKFNQRRFRTMGEQTPYQTLGISEEATFEDIQAVKTRLFREHEGNTQLLEEVEAAYDAIIMERLRLRQEGKIKVPEKIRFPERQAESTGNGFPSLPAPTAPSWLANSLDTPSQNDILWPAGFFASLILISWLTQGAGGSIQSLLLVVGVFGNIFFLNRKQRKFGKALLLSLGALLVGIILGTVLGQLLLGANVAIGPNLEQIAATITFVILWLISSFVR
ncbi:CPP1-like family protein [Synechocystis sp. FACHB-383]|uniref:CPP1-like family protein n=2 Tax=Synechocystis TaxID=1142 RepID=A0ABR9VW13_9SYNC|nr:CPP1-like family protein [Synechocystis sp. FACHB-383]MBE9242473.1 CPP1-like family protein [Synechocystis salina LEGE 00041]MBE9255555.1 CPP1-like family protein [Synechocystis salina LEGE 00031]